MARDPKAKVTLTLRMPERLRSRLERTARASDVSLNNEINRRLERSLDEEKSQGGEHNSILLQMLAAAIRLTEEQTGKAWVHDDDTRLRVHYAVSSVIGFLGPDAKTSDTRQKRASKAGYEKALEAIESISKRYKLRD